MVCDLYGEGFGFYSRVHVLGLRGLRIHGPLSLSVFMSLPFCKYVLLLEGPGTLRQLDFSRRSHVVQVRLLIESGGLGEDLR